VGQIVKDLDLDIDDDGLKDVINDFTKKDEEKKKDDDKDKK